MFGKKKKQPEIFTEISTPETQESLREELYYIGEGIDAIHEKIARSFQDRVAGLKHDSNHNIDADTYTQQLETLEKRKKEIEESLARYERVQPRIAEVAVHDTDSETVK